MNFSMARSDKKTAFSGRELSIFCSQLALILRSGIPLHEGLDTMKTDGGGSERQSEIFGFLGEQLQSGMSMHSAFEAAGVFPDYMLGMVDIGEKSGRLDTVMVSLSDYYDRDDRLKQDIYSAVTYPLLLLGMIAAVIVVLVVRVLPIFQQVFADLGTQLSGPAEFFLNAGVNASRWAMIVIVALVVVVVALFLFAKFGGGSAKLSGLAEKLPIIGKLSHKISAGRFASALSLMLASGYDTRPALDLIEKILTNSEVKKRMAVMKTQIDGGETVGDAIRASNIFQGLYGRMIAVGYKTGSIDEVTREVADLYEEEVNISLGNLIAVLEPSLVVCFSVVIGIILISVMLPLIGIMSSMG